MRPKAEPNVVPHPTAKWYLGETSYSDLINKRYYRILQSITADNNATRVCKSASISIHYQKLHMIQNVIALKKLFISPSPQHAHARWTVRLQLSTTPVWYPDANGDEPFLLSKSDASPCSTSPSNATGSLARRPILQRETFSFGNRWYPLDDQFWRPRLLWPPVGIRTLPFSESRLVLGPFVKYQLQILPQQANPANPPCAATSSACSICPSFGYSKNNQLRSPLRLWKKGVLTCSPARVWKCSHCCLPRSVFGSKAPVGGEPAVPLRNTPSNRLAIVFFHEISSCVMNNCSSSLKKIKRFPDAMLHPQVCKKGLLVYWNLLQVLVGFQAMHHIRLLVIVWRQE